MLVIMILGGLNVGYCITVYGAVESYFSAQFYLSGSSLRLFSLAFEGAGLFGLAMGSFVFGVPFINDGRRSAIQKACFIGFVGCFFQLVKTYSTILLGRLLYGISCGILSISCMRYLEESTPQ